MNEYISIEHAYASPLSYIISKKAHVVFSGFEPYRHICFSDSIEDYRDKSENPYDKAKLILNYDEVDEWCKLYEVMYLDVINRLKRSIE